MADTYTKLYVHIIFAVKNREAMIHPRWESELFKYITGIVSNKGQKLLAINGTSNHIHLLIGMKPDISLSDLVREIKKSSNTFINDKKYTFFRFSWQEGFGAFSYSESQIDNVVRYIHSQKEHHKKSTFRDEYIKFLKSFRVDFKGDYLFDWLE